MVSKQIKMNYDNAPPPMDDSWWEAVLDEDETQDTPSLVKDDLQTDPPDYQDDIQEDDDQAASLDWEKASQVYEQDQVISLEVSGCNRGGLLVNGETLQGFVPLSHLVDMPCDEDNPTQSLEKYIDKTLRLKIIECDQERGRIVFSERAALAEPGSRKQLLDSLLPGNCITGTVTNITDFGVFVDLGGVEGLVHVSEISWGRVHHPADVMSLGQDVKVHVIQVDHERARVALSLKRLHPNPWESAEDRYHPEQITDATVTSIVPFGAFARLEEGLDGLIHISEMTNEDDPSNSKYLLEEGQDIRVRVLHVDSTRQRLGLSLYFEDEAE